MEPVRWGILGAARFARRQMGPAIHATPGSVLAAVATSTPARAAPLAALAPGLRIHPSYEALLADPAIDAVYVPLPNHLHVEWTLKALAAGKPVLTEKPLAMDCAGIDRLIAARDAAGVPAAEAFMIVHHPQWHQARRWLEEGEIGRLLHVDAQFSFNNPDPADIRNRAETGGGSLHDIGVYVFGAARWTTGAEAGHLSARIRRENGVEVFAQVRGEMAGNGHRFSYGAMTSMRLYNRQVVTFQGDRGMIRLEGAPFNPNVNDMAEVELHREGDSVLTRRFPSANQYVLQVAAFACHIREGTPFPWTLEDARGTQAMIDRALAGAEEFTL